MDQPDDKFFPKMPDQIDELSDLELLTYLERASGEFYYQAELYFGLKLGKRLPETASSWIAPGIQLLHASSDVESEVYNGGFIQYFENTGGDDFELAIDSLQRMGIPQLAEIVFEASQIVFGTDVPGRGKTRWSIVESLDESAVKVRLNPLDQRYQEVMRSLGGSLAAQAAQFVRTNLGMFFRTSPELPDCFPWMQGKSY